MPQGATTMRNSPNDNSYEILHQIGKGSYATVHKAINRKTGEICAIKKLPVSNDIKTLMNEIGILKDSECKNIVRFLGSDCSNTEVSIVTEYCGGGSVRDVINHLGALTEKQIIVIIKDVLSGLDYLHCKEKIHRDVKAANILLAEDGVAKLADFGVSEPVDTSPKKRGIIGTLLWLAPEVMNPEPDCKLESVIDIWSLGITIIEMAETQPPHKNLHVDRAIELIRNFEVPAPTFQDHSKWSSRLIEFLSLCLEKRASLRKTASQLLRHELIENAPSNTVVKELVAQVYTNNITKPGLDKTRYRQTESLVRESAILFNICKERRNKVIRFDQMEASLNSKSRNFQEQQNTIREIDLRIDELKNLFEIKMKEKTRLERERNDLRVNLDSGKERETCILQQLAKLREKQQRYENAEMQRKEKLMSLGAKSS